MRQFEVFENPSARRGITPFVVVLSSHHLDIEAVLVAPLIQRASPVDIVELLLPFAGATYVMSLISMAAVAPKLLRRQVGSLAEHEDAIQRALQRLFTGF